MTNHLVNIFAEAFTALKGHVHRAATWDDAAAAIWEACGNAQSLTIATAQLPNALHAALDSRCTSNGATLLAPPYANADLPDTIDRAQVGVTGMAFAIAQTGTLVELATNDATRLVSALPRIHIGVVSERALVPALDDAAPRLRKTFDENAGHCVVSFLSGPSRTGDIELRLTLGVHGPEEAHALLLDPALTWENERG